MWELRLQQPQQEPHPRDRQAMAVELLQAFLNAKTTSAESCLMSTIRVVMEIDDQCTHCQRLNGP